MSTTRNLRLNLTRRLPLRWSSTVRHKGGTPLTEGLAYIYTGRWGGKVADVLDSAALKDGDYTVLEGVFRDFEQSAFDGSFGVWGKQGHSALLQPVPKEHWVDYRLDALHTGHDDARSEHRKRDNDPGVWLELKISRTQFEQEQPSSGPPEDRARKRKLIDDCRQMVADWGGGIGHKEQRAAMERNAAFIAIRQHLPQHFLDYLNKDMLGTIDFRRPDRPVAMAALATHLDHLEREWGLT